MKTITIPEDTYLFRAAYSFEQHPHRRICSDTSKLGVYFGTYPLISIAMALEYHESLYLSVYKTTAPITLFVGKYSFREIHHERYFDKQGRFILNVDILPDENINHYSDEVFPIINDEFNDMMSNINSQSQDFKNDWLNSNLRGEIFIANDEDLAKIEYFGDTYWIYSDGEKGYNGLINLIRENNYHSYSENYFNINAYPFIVPLRGLRECELGTHD